MSVGAETDVLNSGGARMFRPDVAYGSNNYLAVWEDYRYSGNGEVAGGLP